MRPAVVASILCILACNKAETPAAQPQESARLESTQTTISPATGVGLVGCELTEGGDQYPALCRVQAIIGAETLQVKDLLVTAAPTRVGDSLLLGAGILEGTQRHILYSFHLGSKTLSELPIPSSSGFEFTFAPDGRHLAHFISDNNLVYGVVRRMPGDSEIVRTPAYYIEGTDVTIAAGEWSGDTVTLFIQPDSLPGRWVRHKRSVRDRAWVIDTVVP